MIQTEKISFLIQIVISNFELMLVTYSDLIDFVILLHISILQFVHEEKAKHNSYYSPLLVEDGNENRPRPIAATRTLCPFFLQTYT